MSSSGFAAALESGYPEFSHGLQDICTTFPDFPYSAFFNKGHRLSGLDAENLGLDSLPAGGRA